MNNLRGALDELQDDAKHIIQTTEDLEDFVDMYAIWHVFMRSYGYIPYADFMDQISVCETLHLLVNLKKESDLISQKSKDIKGRIPTK